MQDLQYAINGARVKLKNLINDILNDKTLLHNKDDVALDAFITLINRFLQNNVKDQQNTRAQVLLDYATERLHEQVYSSVPSYIRVMHQVASMCLALEALDTSDQAAGVIEAIRGIDTTILISGVPYKSNLVKELVVDLQQALPVDSGIDLNETIQPTIPRPIPYNAILDIPRILSPSITQFMKILSNGTPALITNVINDWPALSTRRFTLEYLMKTMGCHRIVPVEIGSSYDDAGWTQKLVTVSEFFKHLNNESEKWYLAQHDLFSQFPILTQDILTPDYCYAAGRDEDVKVNAWFGPQDTVSPAHTDPHDNLLAQVVGYKRVLLVPASERGCVYPHSAETMLSNTAQVDLEQPDFEAFPLSKELTCWEGVLEPGDLLFIPVGWWHHLRSLSVSLSNTYCSSNL
ncbi:hypothetical protein SmJEL517_g00894 [Synchytrium microbalum]|uniref:JmjC domain-containing protein n=1 Tax=Synchytrium microbalum TaxID=1806994 RepID=A0A507CC19_9FUNG|nr:uncharacterized protein SmJEL517_g00894 [Synchytrium microbalum]TPX37162.1 hypothetical protein SmJEL517_g00894 [Synchytrium microbalum]